MMMMTTSVPPSAMMSPAVMSLSRLESFERQVDDILLRLRDSNVRLSLVAVSAARSSEAVLPRAMRAALPITDPVGILPDGAVCGLLLGARPSGPHGDNIVMDRFMQRLLNVLSFDGKSASLSAEVVHRWAGEVEDSRDLLKALDAMPLQLPSFAI